MDDTRGRQLRIMATGDEVDRLYELPLDESSAGGRLRSGEVLTGAGAREAP